MWKLAFIPLVFIAIVVCGASGCFAYELFFNRVEYAYKGESSLSVGEYNEMLSEVGEGEGLVISHIDGDKLDVEYDFKSFLRYDDLQIVGSQKPIMAGVFVLLISICVFILGFLGSYDIYESVMESLNKTK